ncbi:MAG: M23 family metallopeptidase [Planctomycetes bacterium]|nr:M23 family metallopeptidase [Planctomycetota bacterium]
MRAGLLSDPRVVALLRERFIPCLLSALNTADRMADPRDAALLQSYVRDGGERFRGGEREVFLRPDGAMLDVFMSLHGPSAGGQTHMTAAGRRSEPACAAFFRHAELALRGPRGELPAEWLGFRTGTAPEVAAIATMAPSWPMPPAGTSALRVFVRNGGHTYDELHGCELVALPKQRPELVALTTVGARAPLPRPLFASLVRAMVPRGSVDTCLRDESIGGELTFVVTERHHDGIRGELRGDFAMTPQTRAEVSRRENAASMFTATGKLIGRFAARADGTLHELRLAATDGQIVWHLPWQEAAAKAPLHVGVELVEAAAAAPRFQLPCKDYRRGLRGRGNFGAHITAKDSPFAGSWHLAEDVWLPAGTEIVAIADGIVRYSDFSPTWTDDAGKTHWNLGNVIVLEHPLDPPIDGLRHVCSFHVHLGADRRVAVGDTVTRGQVIGTIGKDRSDENGRYAAHLHFGIHRGPYLQIPPSLRREFGERAKAGGIAIGDATVRGELEFSLFGHDSVFVRSKGDGAQFLWSLKVGASAPDATCADIMGWCQGYGDQSMVDEWLRPSTWIEQHR